MCRDMTWHRVYLVTSVYCCRVWGTCVCIANIGCGIICGYFYRHVCYGCGKDYLYF